MLENVIAVILNERDNEITRINAEIVEVLKWLNEAGKKEINRLLYANRYQLELETSIEGVLHLIKSCRLHTSIDIAFSGMKNCYGNLEFILKSNSIKEDAQISWVLHEVQWAHLKKTATIGVLRKIKLQTIEEAFKAFLIEVYAKA